MQLLVFGGTGLIGTRLIDMLAASGYAVTVFSRNKTKASQVLPGEVKIIEWDADDEAALLQHFHGDYSIINLAGENIGKKLWTKKQKARILLSRTGVARLIVQAVKQSSAKPVSILQASATGYYGPSPSKGCDESSPKGTGFLADVVDSWERSLLEHDNIGIRIVFLRTGVVLSGEGGALKALSAPFSYFMGGYIGDGKQQVPWIHITDEVSAIRFLLESKTAQGAFNLVSPNPADMKTLCMGIGARLHRPCRMRIPSFLPRLISRDMANELLLSSQHIVPEKLISLGFQYRYPSLDEALDQLFPTTTRIL
jgi:uncharacterized protein (TIGR01777 family)